MRQAWLVTALMILVGCKDSDGDGSRDGKDCAPDNVAIHPRAEEVCDGTDNDCDGQVDEDVSITAFWDRDRDGYGDAGYARRVCALPEDGSLEAGDCDDFDSAIHPEAAETCNLADDDCDKEFDEGVLLTFYRDDDQDGHGVPDDTTEGCFAPDGYAAVDDDCDDAEPFAWTGAAESCDGVDNDCDGSVDEDLEPVRVWVDADLDGYGDINQPTTACGPGLGVADNALDCDDTDPARSPDSKEIRNNGVNEDCDLYVDEFGVGEPAANEFQTVDDALATAPDGAVVQLDQGIHVITVDLTGEDVIFAGEGCGRTTLYADGNGTAITTDGGTIEHMTVSGGSGTLLGASPGVWYGGGVLVTGDVHLTDLCVEGNSAERGGGVAVLGGTAIIDRVRFVRNASNLWGAGLYVEHPATVDVWASEFVANHAEGDGGGGGLRVQGATALVSNTVFSANTCAKHGCAVSFESQQDDLGDFHAPIVTIDQATFHANAGLDDFYGAGQAIWGESATLTLHNVLFTGHPVDHVIVDTLKGTADEVTPTVTKSFVGYHANAGADESFRGWQVDRIGDRAEYLAADPTLPPEQWDLRLLTGSGFVDDGDPAVLDPDGSRSDLGAFGGASAPEGWDFGFVGDEEADGLPDGWEVHWGTNRWIDDSADDDDGDALTHAEELAAGSDPLGADTDLDGVDDGVEVGSATAPADPRDNAPIVDVAAERWGLVGQSLWLDAGDTIDPDGDPLSYTWAVLTRPPTSTVGVTAPSDAATSFVPDVPGDYQVEVTVDDGGTTRTGVTLVRAWDGVVVPDDHPTVQAAADAASSGQAIGVRPGTWVGPASGDDLVVIGLVDQGAADDVVIDAGGLDSALVSSGTAAVAHLTLTGGFATFGGGLRVDADGPVELTDVTIRGNRAVDGGGIWMSGGLGSLELRDVRVLDNVADRDGGGLWYLGEDVHEAVIAERTRFAGNRAGGEGGGMHLDGGTTSGVDADMFLYACEFVDNEAGDDGAAFTMTGLGGDLNAWNLVLVGNRGSSLGWSDEGRVAIFSDVLARNEVGILWDGFADWSHFHGVWADVPLEPFGPGGAEAALVPSWQQADPGLASFVDDGVQDDLLATLPDAPTHDLGFADHDDPDGSWSDIGSCGGPAADPACLGFALDGDGDGLGDGWERAFGLDPTVVDSGADDDGDGLDALTEAGAGTRPDRADSDLDGVSDAEELAGAGDPLDDRDHRPLAVATEVVQADLGQEVVIDGSGSVDPDGDPLTWSWRVLSAPAGSTIDDTSLTGANTASVSLVTDAEGVIRLGLTVSGGGADSRERPVWVHVRRTLAVPGEYATIDEAVAAASPGDIVALGAGSWPITFETTDVPIVFAGAGADQTVLTGQGSSPLFVVLGGHELTLRDVTITGGANQSGGAINCDSATLTLERVLLTRNTAYDGGGMYLDACTTTLIDTDIVGNVSSWSGAGVYAYLGSFDWIGGAGRDNRAGSSGGVGRFMSVELTLRNVILHGNWSASTGSALFVEYWATEYVGFLDAEHLTVTGNEGLLGAIHRIDDIPVTLTHSIFADNSLYAFYDADVDHVGVALNHNDYFGNGANTYPLTLSQGPSEIKLDPKFVAFDRDAPADVVPDLHLRDDSPVRDVGATADDPDGSLSDYGAYGGPYARADWDVYFRDTDGDGMADGWEVEGDLDAQVNDAALDPDGDTLVNATEYVLRTHPQAVDSDEDGVDDVVEVAALSDPADPADHRPNADAGGETTVAVGATASLSGSGDDPNLDPITFQWSLVGKPGRSALDDGDLAGATTAAVQLVPDIPGEYVLQLLTSDGVAWSAPSTTVVHVPGDLRVPEDYATVEAAFAAIESGYTIEIGPGVFPTELDLDGKDLTLIGAGFDATVLDGQGHGAVVIATAGELVTLEGLTVTNGLGGRGGALWFEGGSDVALIDVVVSDSVAAEGGGVYHDDGGVLTITGGRIVDNLAGHRGGGLALTGTSAADLLNVLVAGNRAPDNQGGGIRSFNGDVTATNCVFADNVASEGGAIYVTGTATSPLTVTLDHVTGVFNEATTSGAFVKIGTNTSGVLIDTVIAGNLVSEAVEERTDSLGYASTYTLFDNELQFVLPVSVEPVDGVDGNKVGADADLAYATDDGDWTDDDWSLGPLSAAIDAGDPAGPLDPDGSAPDMGAFGGADGDWVP